MTTRLVLDHLTDGVAILDRTWVCRYANQAAATFLHTSVEALVGANYHRAYPRTENPIFTQAYERVMSSGVSEVVEAYYPPWDQHFRNRVLSFGSGIVLFLEDVSAQRRREAADRRSHDLLQQVVDSAPIAIVLRDLEGRYRVVNRFAADFVGASQTDMLGCTADAFLPPPARHGSRQGRGVRAQDRPAGPR